MRLRSIFWELVESFKNCEDVDPFADSNSVDFLPSSTWVPRDRKWCVGAVQNCNTWKMPPSRCLNFDPKKNIKKTSKKLPTNSFPQKLINKTATFPGICMGLPHPVRSLERSCWSRAACPIWRRQPVFGGPFLKKHPRCNGSPISNRFGNLYFWETTKMMNTSWHLKEYEGLLSRWVLWNFTVFKHREQFQPIFTVLDQLGHKRPPSDAVNWSV